MSENRYEIKWLGSRVRASFTLENAVLIPLFTLIIVFLIGAGLYLHDNMIMKNALTQGAVILEKDILKTDVLENDASENSISAIEKSRTQKQQLNGQVQSYISEKAVLLKNVSVLFAVTDKEITAEGKAVFQLSFVPGLEKNIYRKETLKRSYPPDYIRRLRAADNIGL